MTDPVPSKVRCPLHGPVGSDGLCYACVDAADKAEQRPSKDLLPCPFCGSPPRWCKDEEHECHLIVCTGCAISIDFQENPDTETVQELRDIMAAKWNRRAAQPPPAEHPDLRANAKPYCRLCGGDHWVGAHDIAPSSPRDGQ